jgi:hypothetical protein
MYIRISICTDFNSIDGSLALTVTQSKLLTAMLDWPFGIDRVYDVIDYLYPGAERVGV